MSDEPTKRSPAAHLPKWQKGQSGNPKGRPKGSRVKFAETFLKDLQESWEKHGVKALDDTARRQPAMFVRVAASVLPKEVETTIRTELDGMTDSEVRAFIQAELAKAAEADQPVQPMTDTVLDQPIDTKH